MVLTAVIALLSACSKSNEEPTTAVANPEDSSIRFNAGVWRIKEGRRATTIDDNDDLQGQDLRINAYYNGTNTAYLADAKLHYDTGAWKFWDGSSQLHYYWPIEGSVAEGPITVSSLDFVGFCPYTTPDYISSTDYDASDGVSFTCNMSSYMTLASQTSMQECLIAVLNAQTYTTQAAAPRGALPLVFKHPFALVKFTITDASGTNVKINSISIAGLKTGGTCTYDGTDLEWSSLSGSTAMTVAEELEVGETTESTPFVVIPNDYGSKTITVNATWNDWSDDLTIDVSTSVSIDWQAGKSYTYNLTLSKYAVKVDTEEFTEQW